MPVPTVGLVARNINGQVRVFDVETGEEVIDIVAHQKARAEREAARAAAGTASDGGQAPVVIPSNQANDMHVPAVQSLAGAGQEDSSTDAPMVPRASKPVLGASVTDEDTDAPSAPQSMGAEMSPPIPLPPRPGSIPHNDEGISPPFPLPPRPPVMNAKDEDSVRPLPPPPLSEDAPPPRPNRSVLPAPVDDGIPPARPSRDSFADESAPRPTTSTWE